MKKQQYDNLNVWKVLRYGFAHYIFDMLNSIFMETTLIFFFQEHPCEVVALFFFLILNIEKKLHRNNIFNK